ncbi:hypothetical protein JOF29_003115 [Kribbella aluminosa]|uniref:Thiamine pyrophosphate enzyme N-terminal TPP-binding domain-containing protein n=1 Tax=Kribbella aluminosa TaxID=416017 RepID=A0ABS4UK46_9ACTN|nr:thiamine pyrophosphate-binding protein [Kribbella aluminosa]MBP2352032.1 hypothetical protein [Kribbella aluminosa]
MSTTVADFVLQRLREWDVDHVFGYAGDGINGLLSAWQKAGNEPRFVQARHEEMAAFEAVGYAKFTGRVGVCTATSGPGAIHLLNGLYDAKLDHVPVVAIVGQTARSAMGGSYQQEVDLHTLYKDVASDYCETVMVTEQLPNVLDRAIRIAAAPPYRDRADHSVGPPGARVHAAVARVQDGAVEHGPELVGAGARGGSAGPCGGDPERGLAGRDPRGAGCAGCGRRGDGAGGADRRRGREGAARQGRAA